VITAGHVSTALQVAEEGTVLLKNSGSLLPLSASSVGSIAVIGTNANPGLSDQNCTYGSPQNVYPYSGGGSACANASTAPVSPLAGIQAAAPGATVTYNSGSSQSSAVAGEPIATAKPAAASEIRSTESRFAHVGIAPVRVAGVRVTAERRFIGVGASRKLVEIASI